VIEYATNSAFTRDVGRVASTTAWKDITGLNPNTTYYVRVMARGVAGESKYSTARSVTTARITLDTPVITHWAWDREAIGIVWTPVNNADNYRIEYTTDENFLVGVRTITVGPSPTSRSITGLRSFTIYHVRIRATGAGFTDSDYSIPVFIRTPRSSR